MRVRIIVDSSTDHIPAIRQRLEVIPLTVTFGDTEYIDGVTIDHKAFYEKLSTAGELPRTSQVPPDRFLQKFEEVAEAGDSAVVITLSSQLSGTLQSAVIASSEYDNIYVIDSGTVTMGAGILAERALQLADAGMDAAAIAQTINEEKEHIRIIALVDTLEYLQKGGRLSRTAAVAGSLLNIKPVIAVEHGIIRVMGKARGTKQGNSLLARSIQGLSPDPSLPMLFGYTGLTDEPLSRFLLDSEGLWDGDLRYTCLGSIIGTHAGPGAYGAAFFCK